MKSRARVGSPGYACSRAPSIHVSLYAYGGISAACMMSWVDLTATFARSDRQTDLRTIREDALISRSRCRATKWFLDSGKDVWIQLDHDIEFTAADVIRMAELADQHQATVCIPYSCRSLPARPALRPKAEHLQALKHQVNDAECAAELVPITMFASGCLAIPRKCLLATLDALEGSGVQNPYRIDWCEDVRVERFPTLWMPCVFVMRWSALILSDRFSHRHFRRLPNFYLAVFKGNVHSSFDSMKDAKLHEFS